MNIPTSLKTHKSNQHYFSSETTVKTPCSSTNPGQGILQGIWRFFNLTSIWIFIWSHLSRCWVITRVLKEELVDLETHKNRFQLTPQDFVHIFLMNLSFTILCPNFCSFVDLNIAFNRWHIGLGRLKFILISSVYSFIYWVQNEGLSPLEKEHSYIYIYIVGHILHHISVNLDSTHHPFLEHLSKSL